MELQKIDMLNNLVTVECSKEEIKLFRAIHANNVKGGIFRCLSDAGKDCLLKNIPNIEKPVDITSNDLQILGKV